MTKYLITGDPVASFQPRFDTTLRVMAELRRRGIEVDYCDLLACDPHVASTTYLATLPVQAVVHVDPTRDPGATLGPRRHVDARDYTVVIHRKDPPVDTTYRAHATHFAGLSPGFAGLSPGFAGLSPGFAGLSPASAALSPTSAALVPASPCARPGPRRERGPLQINDPAEVLRHSEHLLAATAFPEFAVPTVHCPDLPALLRAVRAQPLEAVVKPLGECSGRGIAFFPPLAAEAELAAYWAAHADSSGVVVQPFQPAITTRGDLRILVMNRRILGSVARIPRPGSRLANLHQGASVRAFEPTPRQLAAVAAVADALTPRGLHLLGLDFIGDLLSEINFTSPSALVQINEVMHKRAEQELVDEIVEMTTVSDPSDPSDGIEIERRAGLRRVEPDVA